MTEDNDVVFRIEILRGAKDTRKSREHFRRQSALITTVDSHINIARSSKWKSDHKSTQLNTQCDNKFVRQQSINQTNARNQYGFQSTRQASKQETHTHPSTMHQKALIGAASRYIAGRNAVQTVYWRSTTNGDQAKMLKVSKTCAFGKPSNQPALPSHIKQEHKLRC